MSKIVPFQTIQLSISTQFKRKYTVYLSKTFPFQAIQFSQTVLIQRIQFSISMQLVLFNPKKRPYQVLPFRARVDLGAMAMKGCFLQSSSITGASPSYRLVSYPGLSWGGSYPSPEVQSVYSTTPADLATT